MGQNSTEEKLMIEKQIADLRRDFKHISAQVDDKKKEYHYIVDSIKTNSELLEDKKKELSDVLKDISNSKLTWAIERDAELRKLEEKSAYADSVIKKESSIDEKKREVALIQQKTVEELNEIRRVKLESEAVNTATKALERDLERRELSLKEREEKIEKERKSFKEHITKLITEWNG